MRNKNGRKPGRAGIPGFSGKIGTTEKSGRAGFRRFFSVTLILVNIVLLSASILLFVLCISVYRDRLQEENLGNIANLNQAASMKATALIGSWDTKLLDITQLVTHRDLSHAEVLDLLADSNSDDKLYYELIDETGNGFVAQRDENGIYPAVSYSENSYDNLRNAFDDADHDSNNDIYFTPEFTDNLTARKFFGIFRHLQLKNEDGERKGYTLMLATFSNEVLAAFNAQNDFTGQSTVLTDANGDYIVSNIDFKSNNFFEYLYAYNDLTLDQKNEIKQKMNRSGSGELYYQNTNVNGADCVFRYEKMETNDWYCITSVPLSSFHSTVFNMNYVLYAVLMLLFLFVLDVTWLQRINRRLRVSMAREKEASEAKTDFLSRMSHDIRTPLNGIIGLTTLALEEKNPPETANYLQNIHVSGQFLKGLVNDILDLSKVESGNVELRPEPYSSSELHTYINAIILPLCIDKGITFQMFEPDDHIPVMLDRLRFNQIVFNLLSNAVKYTPSGGLVVFDRTATPLDDGRVRLTFTVRDNGIGMSEAFQKEMFDSFTQEHAQTASTGSGLGLSIVRGLIRLMNGTISVVSRQGEGSTFTFTLEVDVYNGEESKVHLIDETILQGKRVLLCEDNAINVLVAKKLLEKWGLIVDTADNGKIGLEAYLAAPDYFYDVIFMDIMMPEMNGYEATRAVRASEKPDAKTIAIIAMTANAYDEDVENCLSAGMNDHVGKPIDVAQLRSTLAKHVRSF